MTTRAIVVVVIIVCQVEMSILTTVSHIRISGSRVCVNGAIVVQDIDNAVVVAAGARTCLLL